MFCLDTYALCEISQKNPHYKSIMDSSFCIPEPIMAEFYSILLREYNERTANYWLGLLKPACVETPLQILIEAVKFRYEHKKERISFFDAVGYIFAKKNKMQFVTGDKAFKNRKNVLFIR